LVFIYVIETYLYLKYIKLAEHNIIRLCSVQCCSRYYVSASISSDTFIYRTLNYHSHGANTKPRYMFTFLFVYK